MFRDVRKDYNESKASLGYSVRPNLKNEGGEKKILGNRMPYIPELELLLVGP